MGPENRLFRIAPGEKREGPSPVSDGPSSDPGNDLLSREKHYHRPRMLNGRVRNGNGCDHPGVVTGNIRKWSGRVVVLSCEPASRVRGRGAWGQCGQAIGC